MPGWLRSVGSGPLTSMLSNTTSTTWINQHQRKGRQGGEDDRSRSVHTGSGQRGAGTKGRSPIRFGLVFRGGPIELEQVGSADPPLAVHCLYGGRHRQHRRGGTEEVYRLGGPLGAAPARLAPVHRSVLVRAAVCRQAAQRATHRLNGRAAARRKAASPTHEWQGGPT